VFRRYQNRGSWRPSPGGLILLIMSRAKPVAGGRQIGHAGAPAQPGRDPTSAWEWLGRHKVVGAAGAALAAMGLVRGLLDGLAWEWLAPAIAWAGLAVIVARLAPLRIAVGVWASSLAIALAAPFIVASAHVQAAQPASGVAGTKHVARKKQAQRVNYHSVDLGSGARDSVTWREVAWTLTIDHRLIGIKLDTGYRFANRAAPDAMRLEICGDVLVQLDAGGRIVKLSAASGVEVGHYDAGHLQGWTCLGSRFYAVSEDRFVLVELHQGPRRARTKAFSSSIVPVSMAADGTRVWMLDGNALNLLAWDASNQNLRYRGSVGEGAESLELLHGKPWVLHPNQRCLRTIDRGSRAEQPVGVALGSDAKAYGGDGTAIVVGESATGVVTLVRDMRHVARIKIPIPRLTIDDVDLTPRHLVIADSALQRLVIVDRASLERRPTMPRAHSDGCN
jgi:hypothetical protein